MKKFDTDLNSLHEKLNEMSELACDMLTLVVRSVKRREDHRADLDAMEERVNQFQTEVDADAVRMITVYSPVATDLRRLLVVTHITQRLERTGDQVINICEALAMMSDTEHSRGVLEPLVKMGELARGMLSDALDAYFSNDEEKAVITRAQDDVLDALNDQVNKELLTIEVLRDVLAESTNIADAVAQILIARYLERIGDLAKNICKEVVFLVSGDDVRHQSEGH